MSNYFESIVDIPEFMVDETNKMSLEDLSEKNERLGFIFECNNGKITRFGWEVKK